MSRLFADHALARRLERAEGDANRRFVEARARVQPEIGAAWIEVAGTYAMFDGVGSPLTQTFGLGLFAPAAAADLDQLESFFFARGAASDHEVSPLGEGTGALLCARGYEAIEYSSVMFQDLEPAAVTEAAAVDSRMRVRRVAGPELSTFNETAADGWSETPELREFMLGFGRVTSAAQGMWSFMAEWDGRPAATASMMIHDGVALLAGASTVPGFRRHGAQAALLAARLTAAREQGCDAAMMVALPGSGSQRNAERRGFRIAYTRTKWRRRCPERR